MIQLFVLFTMSYTSWPENAASCQAVWTTSSPRWYKRWAESQSHDVFRMLMSLQASLVLEKISYSVADGKCLKLVSVGWIIIAMHEF